MESNWTPHESEIHPQLLTIPPCKSGLSFLAHREAGKALLLKEPTRESHPGKASCRHRRHTHGAPGSVLRTATLHRSSHYGASAYPSDREAIGNPVVDVACEIAISSIEPSFPERTLDHEEPQRGGGDRAREHTGQPTMRYKSSRRAAVCGVRSGRLTTDRDALCKPLRKRSSSLAD